MIPIPPEILDRCLGLAIAAICVLFVGLVCVGIVFAFEAMSRWDMDRWE